MAKKESKSAAPAAVDTNDGLHKYATAYVIGAVVLSAGLNAMANGHHADDGHKPFAWALGVAVPIGVLLLGKVAGLFYKRGRKEFAYVVGSIAAVLLLLSVFHCAESIQLLTGSHWTLAGAMAVGIDAGLLSCEACSTLAAAPKGRKRSAKKAKATAAPVPDVA